MDQAEIDALLKDSMFEDSSFQDSKPPNSTIKHIEESEPYADQAFESYDQSRPKKETMYEETGNYGNEEFESYEDSKRTFSKKVNNSKPLITVDPKQKKQQQSSRNKLEDIKQEASPPFRERSRQNKKSSEKPKSKTGIHFYPPKQQTIPTAEKRNLPHNYARLQEREKELLLTSLTQEIRQLKEQARRKENEYKKLENAYKVLLQEKAHQAPSVKEATLQKQLAALQSKYDKFQNLYKLERERNHFKTASKAAQNFVSEQVASQKEQEYLELIDQLKERLISSNSELKTLQAKMNEGENYIDELKRKMKRVQQLEFKMQKMAEQAQNDREYIRQLKENSTKLQAQLFQAHKEKRLLEVEIRRYNLAQVTQADTLSELAQVRKQKQLLQMTLRDFASNMNNINKKGSKTQWCAIEDSGQLLKP